MRLTPYGACAALGVVLAMGLSGRTARRLRLRPEAVWDAGLFAVMSCFIASRLLLVLSDPRAFSRYPLLVLSLPSLTLGGMGLGALATWLYLRRKRLPVLKVLDAFAPPGALLATFLELGHWMDGSEPGMPVFNGDKNHGLHLLPVSLYGVLLSVALLAVLWIALGKPWPTGRVAGLALMLGGAAAFGLDMLSLPEDLFSGLPLEAGQLVALTAMLAGVALWSLRPASDISV